MHLSQEAIDRRREVWIGLGIGIIAYIGNGLGSWWLLDALRYGKQELLAVPLLALGFLMVQGFVFRKLSDRVATAFVLAGLCLMPIAWLVIKTWLQRQGLTE